MIPRAGPPVGVEAGDLVSGQSSRLERRPCGDVGAFLAVLLRGDDLKVVVPGVERGGADVGRAGMHARRIIGYDAYVAPLTTASLGLETLGSRRLRTADPLCRPASD